MINIGIAGCRRGASFATSLNEAGFKLHALMDPKPDAMDGMGDAQGVSHSHRFTEFGDLLVSGVEAVIVASPMPFHAPQAVSALDLGVHVLSEVTAATSINQCVELRQAARRSDANYMMAENCCYFKEVQMVAAMVSAGIFGDVYYAEGQYLHAVPELIFPKDGSVSWREKWQMGRRGLTYPTHSLGPVITWLGGRVVSLSSRGTGARTWPQVGGDNTAVMLCQTESGALASIRQDFQSHRPAGHYYQLQGTRGCYESPKGFGDTHKISLVDAPDGGENSWRPLSDFEGEFLPRLWKESENETSHAGHGGADFLVLNEFAKTVRGETESPVDVYTAIDWTMTALISELSSEQGGEPISVPNSRNDELDIAAANERESGRDDS